MELICKVMNKRLFKLLGLLIVLIFGFCYFPEFASNTMAAAPTERWVAQPLHITPFAGSSSPQGYTPNQIRTAYGLPSSGGAGATIAIIDAYHTPSIWNDLGNFSARYNLPLPTSSNFEVHQMTQNIETDSSWTQETCLDVEWAHAIAPEAKILLVEALDDRSDHLIAAINYVTSRPDVVAVSMSWGTPEYSQEIFDDRNFFSAYPMTFFAASGDNGSSAVLWPASSPSVVAIGGTTLNLNNDSTFNSEIAWGGSVGGISKYEPMPTFQTSYGLTGNKRQVPDVSYNANATTGFSVYCNSQWYRIGGTSAGAPQWAAIYALGHSANNVYLYARAKTAYSTYFRDIISGSNNNNTATLGYDLVTGLGSPLTYNFAASLTVSPISGPAQASLTLNGTSLTPNGFANISYLSPLTSKWTLIANNITIDSTGQFTYPFVAPDLFQNNLAGDSQPASNNIIFQVKDNSNGRTYNSTTPYMEMRRGLTQIASQTAVGLYGNNTNLATTALVQNGQTITVLGSWFSPSLGTASLFWDDLISLGNAMIDSTGAFNVTVTVPTSTVGQHRITVNDGSVNFCVNVTRPPLISNDYSNNWHTSDITVNLTNETNVIDTCYSINNGPVFNVSTNGQPVITTEGSANTIEYWSTWNMSGVILELPHSLLTNIQLENTAPQASMQINNGATQTSSTNVNLFLNANSASGVSQMRFSNDGVWDTSIWETFSSTKTWTLANGNGVKTIYCQVKDNAGLISNISNSITLYISQATPNPTLSPTTEPTLNPTSTPTATMAPRTMEPQVTPEAPESNIQMILVLLTLVTVSLLVIYKKTKVNSKLLLL
jgi:hypothetical protein